MAFAWLFSSKEYILKTKSYKVTYETLGHGAFGVVYKGEDAKKNPIAAKCINGKHHHRIKPGDLENLLQLDHPNVIKIFDIERKEDIYWQFMPFCEFGDLNNFYRTRDIPLRQSVRIMQQIISGVEYLHNKDIIHRDIKPGNILVASDSPVHVMLTDFDLSKFLPPDALTSLMTTNVGTLPFIAPEFFQFSATGRVSYHRSIDIFSAGLTYLAMLQAKPGSRALIPEIELPDESGSRVLSIGQLLYERVKYKVGDLNIVDVSNYASGGPDKKQDLKKLIQRMTQFNPEERPTAAVAGRVSLYRSCWTDPVRRGRLTRTVRRDRVTNAFRCGVGFAEPGSC